MDNLQLIGAFFVGIIAGFISAIAGGGSLISIPFLLFLGVPPQITLATNKLGGVGMAIGGTTKFIKEEKVIWKYAIGLSIAGVLASFVGSRILITAKPEVLNIIIGILLLVMVPTIFFNKDFGVKRGSEKKYSYLGYFFYFCFSIIASFFGGVGPFMIGTVILFFGLPFIEAGATDLFAFLVLSTTATIIYFFSGLVNLQLGIILFISMILGGYLGAHTAIKKGNEWVKIFYAIIVVISALKILIG